MTKREKLFDPKCWELAEAFLEDEPALASPEKTRELAACIQEAIEDWVSFERDELERARQDNSQFGVGA